MDSGADNRAQGDAAPTLGMAPPGTTDKVPTQHPGSLPAPSTLPPRPGFPSAAQEV